MQMRTHRIDSQERKRIALSPTLTRVATGEDDLAEWDDDELMRGRRRDPQGFFRGRDPQVIPRVLHEELARRKFQQAFAVLYADLADVSARLRDAALGRITLASEELRAIEMVMERTLGKPTDRIQLEASINTSDPPWMQALKAGIIGDSRAVTESAEVIDVTPAEDPRADDDEPWESLDDEPEQAANLAPDPPDPDRTDEGREPLPVYDDSALWEHVVRGERWDGERWTR